MEDFRKQIREDIEEYQADFPNVENIEKPEWAFNFWILDKLFRIDEDLIETYIIDYNDEGIDCFVWLEEDGDLYLIQNKYYSDKTIVSNKYIQSDFLTRAIGSLEKGMYRRCEELQAIYDKNSDRDDFTVHFNMYVTNNECKTAEIEKGIKSFNEKYKDKSYIAAVYGLDDIKEKYYGEPIQDSPRFDFTITTVNQGTMLAVNNRSYGMNLKIDAKYILVPVYDLYRMCGESKKSKYALFEENIREYLGAAGNVNKKIRNTLLDPEDRTNFFFYNNGITLIAESIEQQQRTNEFKIRNPQIVNGCQTVSTIFETLDSLPSKNLKEEFKDTYVLVKTLVIPSKKDEEMAALYKAIVTYNNSQNAIDQKTFEARAGEFSRLKTEFERKGFLLCTKQSDKYQYTRKFPKATALLDANREMLVKFGLEDLKKTKDFLIDLEKFLQVALAFSKDARAAIQKKSQLLKADSEYYLSVMNVISDNSVTINDLLNLYLLYLRAEKKKQASENKKSPNPFYLIYCFSKYECDQNPGRISGVLSSKEAIDKIILIYSYAFKDYYNHWKKANNLEYNDMIKSHIDEDQLEISVDNARDLIIN